MSLQLLEREAAPLSFPFTLRTDRSALDALKDAVQKKQDIIDELGKTVNGKDHLDLCNLQTQTFNAISTLDRCMLFVNSSKQAADRFLNGTHGVSDLLHMLWSPFDDTQSLAANIVTHLCKADAAPITKQSMVDAKVIPNLVRMLERGSLQQRGFAINALLAMCLECKEAKQAILRIAGARNSLHLIESMLVDAHKYNMPRALRDTVALLCTLSLADGSPSKLAQSGECAEHLALLLRYKPREEDGDAHELALLALSRMVEAWGVSLVRRLLRKDLVKWLVALFMSDAAPRIQNKNGFKAETICLLQKLVWCVYEEPWDGTTHPCLDVSFLEATMHQLNFGTTYATNHTIELLYVLLGKSSYGTVSNALLRHKAVQRLVQLLNSPYSEELHPNASRLMATWAKDCTEAQRVLIEENGLSIFMRIVKASSGGPVLKANAMRVLGTLVSRGRLLAQKIASDDTVLSSITTYAHQEGFLLNCTGATPLQVAEACKEAAQLLCSLTKRLREPSKEQATEDGDGDGDGGAPSAKRAKA